MNLKSNIDITADSSRHTSDQDIMSPPETLPLDTVISNIGFGLWTLKYFTLATLIPMSMLVNLLVAEFTAEEVEFRCKNNLVSRSPLGTVPNRSEFSDDMRAIGASITDASLESPFHDQGHLNAQCYEYSPGNRSFAGHRPCTSFIYSNSTFSSTITTEFDLVCTKEWLRSLFQMLFTLGCLFGAPVGGIFADKFGRQKAMWYGCLTMVLLTALLTVVPLLSVVFICRFLLGFFADIVFIASITIGMEVCPNKYRHAFGTVESLPYAVMLPLLAGIAYLCRDWRPVQLWASLPLFIATVLASPMLLDESPRWLVSQGRLQEAEGAVLRAAKLNKSTSQLPPQLGHVLIKTHKDQLQSEAKSNSTLRSHLVSLVSTREMRRLTVVLTILWFFEGTLYISLPLNASTHQSPFLYLALLGLLEVPGTLVVTPLGGRYGRKRVGCVCALTTAAMMLAMSALRAARLDVEWLLMALAVVAYITLVGVSQMTLLMTAELFPTTVRSLGSSLGFFMNNLGYCIPPLMEILLPEEQPELTLLLYGIMAFCSACLLLLLPETNKRPLFETVAELVTTRRQRRANRLSRDLHCLNSNIDP